MRPSLPLRTGVRQSCKRITASTLCMVLATAPLGAEPPSRKSAPPQLQGEARVLHALNRFTFGPRPGEVAAVESEGLDRWFDRQLKPASIPDGDLDRRLDQYPAMRLNLAELQERFPDPEVLKQMASGRVLLPSDPVERARVRSLVSMYEEEKAVRADNKAASAGPVQGASGNSVAGVPPAPMDPATMNPATINAREQRKAVQAGAAALRDAAQTPASSPAPISLNTGDPSQFQAAIQHLLQLPPGQRLPALYALSPEDLLQLRSTMGRQEKLGLMAGLDPQQREQVLSLTGPLRLVTLEDTSSRVLRDIYSNRELEAVMTDFWLNHFSVYLHKDQAEPYFLPEYESQIRAHALGHFEDLLVAVAQSPAMQTYLDNWRSVGPNSLQAMRNQRAQAMRPGAAAKAASEGLNENYGRELMELHTLGVNGGYTQADVTAVSKVFTGWTVLRPNQGGGFSYEPRRHEPGSKVVLGKTIREGGMQEGLEVLHMLASSPATAHFLCEKLAVRFVSDDPPPALVDRMAKSYLSSHGDIKTVLRTLYHSPEFWSPAEDHAKVKTPIEFVASAVRASGADINDPQPLVAALEKLGMPVYGMQTPNGYSWKQEDWVNTGALVNRMNFALTLSGNRLPGTQLALQTYVAPQQPTTQDNNPEQANALEAQLEALLLGSPASPRTRETVLAQANDQTMTEQAASRFDVRGKGRPVLAAARSTAAAPPANPQIAVMAGLLLGSPEFQRR